MHILIGEKPMGYCTSKLVLKDLDWVLLSAHVVNDQFNRDLTNLDHYCIWPNYAKSSSHQYDVVASAFLLPGTQTIKLK